MTDHENTVLPSANLTVADARRKLAGWHFSQESLSPGQREILYVAEATLRALDDLLSEHAAELADTRLGAERQAKRAAMAEAELARLKDWHEEARENSAYVQECLQARLDEAERERDEARAENEKLREALDPFAEIPVFDESISVIDVRVSRANIIAARCALAAAQEPPAECPDCGLTLEPGEKHSYVEDAGCVAQEPPAEGSGQPYGITATGPCGQTPFVPLPVQEPPAEGDKD